MYINKIIPGINIPELVVELSRTRGSIRYYLIQLTDNVRCSENLSSGLLFKKRAARELCNVIIRNSLSSLNLYDQEENKMIWKELNDRLEQFIIAMILVMLQPYMVIVFKITAKSVLRYNDSKTGKTECVLIGPLLSFSIALVIGIGIRDSFFESFLKYISFH